MKLLVLVKLLVKHLTTLLVVVVGATVVQVVVVAMVVQVVVVAMVVQVVVVASLMVEVVVAVAVKVESLAAVNDQTSKAELVLPKMKMMKMAAVDHLRCCCPCRRYFWCSQVWLQ